MAQSDIVLLAIFALGGLFTVLWFLLRQKDAKQGDEIRLLFSLHDKDAEKLNILELHIAGKHYEARIVDAKFDKLEMSVNRGFNEMSGKFDQLTGVLLDRFTK